MIPAWYIALCVVVNVLLVGVGPFYFAKAWAKEQDRIANEPVHQWCVPEHPNCRSALPDLKPKKKRAKKKVAKPIKFENEA